jgi:hypothetical protein
MHSTSYKPRLQQELWDGVCISGVDEKKITGVVSSAVQRFRIKELHLSFTLTLVLQSYQLGTRGNTAGT